VGKTAQGALQRDGKKGGVNSQREKTVKVRFKIIRYRKGFLKEESHLKIGGPPRKRKNI